MVDTDDLARLRSYQARFAEAIEQSPPATPVPTCGDWSVRELVEHLADIYTWAAHRAGGPSVRVDATDDLSADYRRAGSVLIAALDDLDPDLPCWTLLDDDAPKEHPRIGTVRFWHRRQANETLVHLWDLDHACGRVTDGIDDTEWFDCLSEVAQVMGPRQVRLARVALPAVRVKFHPFDHAPVVMPSLADAATIVVHGSAAELALLAWGRRDASGLQVEGDVESLRTALRGMVP